MHNSNKLTTQDVVLAINNWIRRDGYSQVFKESIQTILQENRRQNRQSNLKRYGSIPFWQDATGHAFYRLEDIKILYADRLKPLLADRLAKKLAIASGLKYYTPYSREAA